MGKLPPELAPLREDRRRIELILGRLDESDDLVERADLGAELSRAVARNEDVIDRALWSRITGEQQARSAELTERRSALREDLMLIHERTLHIDPRNVHSSDGQTFEDRLHDVASRLPALLADEDRWIDEQLAHAPEEVRSGVGRAARHVSKHASERPVPPRTRLSRVVSNAHVKLDHTIEDVASPAHPGLEHLDRAADEAETPRDD